MLRRAGLSTLVENGKIIKSTTTLWQLHQQLLAVFLPLKTFQVLDAIAWKPVKKAGRWKGNTATSGALTRRAGLPLKTSAWRSVGTWPLPPPKQRASFSGREWKEKAYAMSGLEATTLKRRAPGSGPKPAIPGKPHSGRLENQTIGGTKTAWKWVLEIREGGMTIRAEGKTSSSAARGFAQVWIQT